MVHVAFWIAHAVAFAGWGALLLSAGRRKAAVRFARICGAVVAAGYLIVFFLNLGGMTALARDYSVAGVSAVFQNPSLALLGWVHYLALDLWAGSWETEEAGRIGMRQGPLVASLFVTCAFAPIGLLLFLVLSRGPKSRRTAA